MNVLLDVQHLHKAFKDHVAVEDVSLTIPKGSIYGLLGPNGAGKTTTIRMITRITQPDRGEIFLNGESLNDEHVRAIGYLPEERGLYKKMKVGEQLIYLAQLRGMNKKDAVASIKTWGDRLDMSTYWSKKVEELSKGMAQKVQFVSTVMHNPSLIILDEPFTGLDPLNTELIKSEIFRLNEEGTTVIFSTHRMEQVESVCRDIGLISKGRVVLEGQLQDVKQEFKKNHYRLEWVGLQAPQQPYPVVETEDHAITYSLDAQESPAKMLHEVLDQGVQLTGYKEILPSLNQIFIETVQRVEHV